MAREVLPSELWEKIEPVTAEMDSRSRTGRPRVPDWAVLRGTLLDDLQKAGKLDWSRASLDASSLPIKGGLADGAGGRLPPALDETPHRPARR